MKLRVARSILSGGFRFIPRKHHIFKLFKHSSVDLTEAQAHNAIKKHRKMERQNRKDGRQHGK